MQYSIEDGVRHSTAAAYLRPVEAQPNLELVTGATRAAPAVRRDAGASASSGRRTAASSARTPRQVVVSGGTIGSAQLLLLSGVGPADHLRSLGIDVVADLPGVGENLHDHLLSPVIFSAEREVGPPSPGLPACQTHLFWRSRPGLPVPDIQPIHFMVPMYEPWMEGPRERLHAARRDGAAGQPRHAAPHRAGAGGPGRARPEHPRGRGRPREPRRGRRAVPADRRRGRAPRVGRRRAIPRPVGRHPGRRARVRARDRDHLPPPGRHLQDGHRRGRRRRPAAPGARGRGPAGRRRVDHADW